MATLFGTATSSHQVEGGTNNNEWALYKNLPEPAGKACNSYDLYKADHDLSVEMGCDTYRVSIEWARVMDQDGEAINEGLDHYVDVVDDMLAKGLEPFITLHHFNTPVWLEEEGGIFSDRFLSLFVKYVESVVSAFGGRVKFYATFNEPNLYVPAKYLEGAWYPNEQSFFKTLKGLKKIVDAHKAAYIRIKEINPDAQVALVLHHATVIPESNIFYPFNYAMAKVMDYYEDEYFFRRLGGFLDFLGVNYYTKRELSFDFKGKNMARMEPPIDKLEFDFDPECFKSKLRSLQKQVLPIYITETGLDTCDDEKRCDFLIKLFRALAELCLEGLDLRALYIWSLVDNYEWAFGYGPKFGLYAVDRNTFERTPKKSAGVYARLLKEFRKYQSVSDFEGFLLWVRDFHTS